MNYEVQRSNRKTLQIRIDEESERVIVRAPLYTSDAEIRRIVEGYAPQLQQRMEQIRQAKAASAPKLTEAELRALVVQAKAVIPDRVRFYASILGVTYGKITIRNQKNRWGSCSSQGNLNFNCLLMLMPMEMVDYTVVHELCHRREMNHSARFYALLASVLPDHREREKWMKQNGTAILRRNPK